jgi:hypothetical protein
MSKRVTLRFEGLGSISFVAHDAMLVVLGTVQSATVEAKNLAISRRGIEFTLSGIRNFQSLHYAPAGIRDLKWAAFFDAFGLPATARFADRDVPVGYVGAVAEVLCATWTHSYQAAARAPKSRGRPKRNQDWNQDREELFALMLQRQREHGESVIDSIDPASKVDSRRFRGAFKGRTMKAKLDSARQYFYSRKRDSADYSLQPMVDARAGMSLMTCLFTMDGNTHDMPPLTQLLDPQQRNTVPEASDFLRQCRAKTYQDIKAGRIKFIKDGHLTYIPGTEIIRRSTIPTGSAT